MAEPGYADRDVAVRGLKLHYQEWGDAEAPVILMLHGFGVSGHMFDEFAERMQRQYRLIALDHRGHGDSSWSEEGDYSRASFVADTEAFRAALGLDRFILMGHSMGGLIAVTYAAQFPQHVQSLVLVDVGPEEARDGVENIMRFTRGPDNLEFDEFVARALAFNPRRTVENIQERMRHRLKPGENGKWTWKFDSRFRTPDSGIRFGQDETNDDRWQTFRSVPAPTLLVRGGESDVLTQDVAERAVREMQRARLAVVPGAGHSVPGDNPDGFTATVQAFLDDLRAGRFAPPSQAEPTLDHLLEAHGEGNGRRRPGSFVLAAALAGLLLTGAGTLFVMRRRRKPRRKSRAAALKHLPEQADLEFARKRALDLAEELGAAGQRGVRKARQRVKDVDIERARLTAADIAMALEARARHAPEIARSAARGARKKSKRGKGAWVLLPLIAGMLMPRKEEKKRGRPWRR